MIEPLPVDITVLSIDELIQLREDRIGIVKNIQLQLSDVNKKNEFGERMTGIEWSNWRYKANGAVRSAEADLQKLKAELRIRARAPKSEKRLSVFGPLANFAEAVANWPKAPKAVVSAATDLRVVLEAYIKQDQEKEDCGGTEARPKKTD